MPFKNVPCPQCGKPKSYRSKRCHACAKPDMAKHLQLLPRAPKSNCSIGGCDQPHEARGYCKKHYVRLKKAGDPFVTRTCVRHGHAFKGKHTPEYRSWSGMIQRCANPRRDRYAQYGGRGITMCERWLKFEHFLADMGTRPTGTSINRINNDGNYEPTNCRWATQYEQSQNKSTARKITFGGATRNVAGWARLLGISPYTIYGRLNRGDTAANALRAAQTGEADV